MELNNFENQFKNKLNEREIKPSEASWDRLNAMLNVAEKPKINFGWMYIAASFVGVLLVASVFFNQKNEIINLKKNSIVNENHVVKKNIEQPKTNTINVVPPQKNDNLVLTEKKKQSTEKNKENPNKQENPIIANSENQILVASSSIINQETINLKTTNAAVEELVAFENQSLKNAPLTKKSSIKVNPNNLLSQVDGELELSFREKVITKVNKNYQSVKVALVNRNLE